MIGSCADPDARRDHRPATASWARGSVVTRDVPPRTVVGGRPRARPLHAGRVRAAKYRATDDPRPLVRPARAAAPADAALLGRGTLTVTLGRRRGIRGPCPSTLGEAAPRPGRAGAARGLRGTLGRREPFVSFVVSVGAVNVASLAGQRARLPLRRPRLDGRVAHPAAGQHLPHRRAPRARERHGPRAALRPRAAATLARARRIAATALAYNTACCVLVALVVRRCCSPCCWSAGPAWRLALPAMAVVWRAQPLPHLPAGDLPVGRGLRPAGARPLDPGGHRAAPPAHGLRVRLRRPLRARSASGHRGHRLRPRLAAVRGAPPASRGRSRRELVAIGFPLFAAGPTSRSLATGFDRVILLQRGDGGDGRATTRRRWRCWPRWPSCPGPSPPGSIPRMSYALGPGPAPGGAAPDGAGRRRRSRSLAGLPVAVAGLGRWPRR